MSSRKVSTAVASISICALAVFRSAFLNRSKTCGPDKADQQTEDDHDNHDFNQGKTLLGEHSSFFLSALYSP